MLFHTVFLFCFFFSSTFRFNNKKVLYHSFLIHGLLALLVSVCLFPCAVVRTCDPGLPLAGLLAHVISACHLTGTANRIATIGFAATLVLYAFSEMMPGSLCCRRCEQLDNRYQCLVLHLELPVSPTSIHRGEHYYSNKLSSSLKHKSSCDSSSLHFIDFIKRHKLNKQKNVNYFVRKIPFSISTEHEYNSY